jgi:hypothetical protein
MSASASTPGEDCMTRRLLNSANAAVADMRRAAEAIWPVCPTVSEHLLSGADALIRAINETALAKVTREGGVR